MSRGRGNFVLISMLSLKVVTECTTAGTFVKGMSAGVFASCRIESGSVNRQSDSCAAVLLFVGSTPKTVLLQHPEQHGKDHLRPRTDDPAPI